MILRKFIIILSVISLVLPGFVLAQIPQHTSQMPQTAEEAKNLGLKILEKLPGEIEKIWREEAWPIIKGTTIKVVDWLRRIIEPWWKRFLGFLGKEVEKRRPELEKEFKKETKEMQKDLWEKFKDLLK